MKQIETTNVRPTLDERVQFLDIFESNIKLANQTPDQDSSENDQEETRRFFKSDFDTELGVGDKVKVIKGELSGA